MKKIYLFTVILFFFAISCKEETQIQQPDIKVMNGNGILRGGVTLSNPNGGDTRDIDQSGAKVEVVGTNLVVYTTANPKDIGGVFVLNGLDSGTYTIRVSKEGYITEEMKDIYTNGKDSTTLKWNIADSNGSTSYGGIILHEKAPTLSLKAYTASIIQTIKIDTLKDHGKIVKIIRDTSYKSTIDFSFNADSYFDWSKEHHSIGFIAYLGNNPIPNQDKKPSGEYFNGDVELKEYISKKQLSGGVTRVEIKPNILQKIEYSELRSLAQGLGIDLSSKEQIYLHIYPLAHQSYTKIISSKYDPPLLGGGSKWVVQDPITVPIEWK